MLKVAKFVVIGLLVLGMLSLFTPAGAKMASAHALTPQNHQSSAMPQTVNIPNVACTDDGCDGLNPISTGCASSTIVERSASFSADGGGVVELVFNGSCHAAWGFIRFNSAMPSGHTGDAQIFRITDDASQLCDQTGGNGAVLPGQHSCFSGMLGDGASESAIACGYFDNTQLVCTQPF